MLSRLARFARESKLQKSRQRELALLLKHPKLTKNLRILAEDLGQLASIETGNPIAADGEPLPWFTYPAIEYLRRFDFSGKKIFEYGSGYSTFFWSKCGASVWSVEHNRDWFQRISKSRPPNSNITLCSDRDRYPNVIEDAKELFDVIVVDGVIREKCVATSISYLSPQGFIILDNADWYWEAADMLRKNHFLDVSFSGFGPINGYAWTTSFFFPMNKEFSFALRHPQPVGGNRDARSRRTEWW